MSTRTKFHRLRDGLVILLLSAALFGALELGVRRFFPQNLATEYVGGESLGMPDPVTGHRSRPGAVTRVSGPEFSTEYVINSRGLRDATEHSTVPRPGVRRILIVGDSFTFGFGVDYDAIYPVVLERRLIASGRDVELVKAGVAGFDTRQEALYLDRLLPEYDPDLVVLGFLPNDLFTNAPLDADARAGEDVIVRLRSDKESGSHLLMLARRIALASDEIYCRLYLGTARREFYTVPMNSGLAEQAAVTESLLRSAAEGCRAAGAPLTVLSIPQEFQVLAAARGRDLDDVSLDWIDHRFSAAAARDGYVWIPTLSELVSVYRSDHRDLYFRLDGHLNEHGHEVLAEVAAREFGRLLDDPSFIVPAASSPPVPRPGAVAAGS